MRTLRNAIVVALVIVAVAVPLAQAGAARKAPTVNSCRKGNAPLVGGTSINAKTGAGLTARGWDAQSAGGASRGCRP